MTHEDMANIIFDTLFKNTEYWQFDPEHTTPLHSEFDGDDNYTETDMPTQYVDARKGIIRFGYDGNEFEVLIRRIRKE